MNFNLVEMYNGLLRFNKHILNELAEGLKHLPNLDGVSNKININIILDGLNTLMLKIFFIKFKVLQVLDILIGMVKELILLNIMVNTLE